MYLLLLLLIIFIVCLLRKKENFTSNRYPNQSRKILIKGKYKYNKLQKKENKCVPNKNFNLNDIAKFWKKSGGTLEDCPHALIISSDNYNKKEKSFNPKEIDVGGLWNQGFYNLSPRIFKYCNNELDNKQNFCCDAKIVQRSLSKPLKIYGNSYSCYNAPRKIPKTFIGENNNNFIGRFCHIGGENFYKDKQSQIKYGSKFQWEGGQCYKNCNDNDNSNCNGVCSDEYPFPYYYYNKFLNIFNIKEKNKKQMEKKSLKIAKNICEKNYK